MAAQDDGRSGNATDWYSNPLQRVDFAYLSYHDLAVVSKGLAKKFYGTTTTTTTTNCLTPAQIEAVEKIHGGPVDPQGQHLQYFAFEKDVGQNAVTDEPLTKAYFEQIEKLAPFWDATNPSLTPFEKAGGKLILWQGEADWSIPTISSISYYQAVSKGGGPGGSARRVRLDGCDPGPGRPRRTGAALDRDLPVSLSPAYKGHGSVTQASSYEPKVSKALMKPTPWLGKFDTTTVWCNAKGTDCKRKTT